MVLCDICAMYYYCIVDLCVFQQYVKRTKAGISQFDYFLAIGPRSVSIYSQLIKYTHLLRLVLIRTYTICIT
jgi:hypothetical protein